MQPELPPQNAADRCHHGRGRSGTGEGAQRGDAKGVRVEAACLGTDDGSVHAAEASLEDLTVPVDQEVVSDVAPAVAVDVVGVNAADNGGRV